MTTLYVTEPGTIIRCQNEALVIKHQMQVRTCRLSELDLMVILPGVQLTSPVLAELLDRGIETIFLRQTGQFRGRLQGQFPTNPAIRLAQYRTVETPAGLALAQQFAVGKMRNQRTLLQRRNRATQGRITELTEAIDLITAYLSRVQSLNVSVERDTLMGFEGICARTYYQALRYWFPAHWNFAGRNRQPPLDPINALLSWGYGVLLARMFAVCVQAGLDPYLGFFHAIAPYRPNLVLDLMEEFRPIVVDQAAITIMQSQLLTPEDFQPSADGEGIWLGNIAKKLFLVELERQFNNSLRYSPQGRNLKVSQIMLEQARWLARCLVEQTTTYEAFTLR